MHAVGYRDISGPEASLLRKRCLQYAHRMFRRPANTSDTQKSSEESVDFQWEQSNRGNTLLIR